MTAPRRDERGFTLIEMMIAMIIGVMVLAASTSLVLGAMRGLTGTQLRDGIDRNARFVGIGLQRDLEEAGVGFTSLPTFGSVAVYSDTLAILQVPFIQVPGVGWQKVDNYTMTTALPATPPAGANTGNCGATCIEVARDNTRPFYLAVGDLAFLQFGQTRRLLLVTGVALGAATARVTFLAGNRLAGQAAGVNGLDLRTGSPPSIQRLQPVIYYRDAQNQLWRAARLNGSNGAPDGEVFAMGLRQWDVSLRFTDGDEFDQADPALDADATNNYDDIARVHIRATLEADRTDARVNGGARINHRFDWWVAPRNLMYERNAN